MANEQRRAGTIGLAVSGEVQDAKGKFSFNLGARKRTAIIGADGKVHGYKEEGQTPFIEGMITDRGSLDTNALVTGENLTVTLDLANGKTIVLRQAWYAGEGTGDAEEGELPVRWEGRSAEEIS